MTDTRRTILLRMAWFPPDTEIMGQQVRPLCLATWHAMKLMGLQLLERSVELEPRAEYAQLMVYVWLHREDPDKIAQALWSGSWRKILETALEEDADPEPELLQLWRDQREQILQLLEASAVKVKPRKDGKPVDTPLEVVGPDEMAHQISIVRRATGESTKEVLWDLPLYQFRQHYHSEMRWQAHHTVRPGSGSSSQPEEFEGFGAAVLANLQEQDEEEQDMEREQ